MAEQVVFRAVRREHRLDERLGLEPRIAGGFAEPTLECASSLWRDRVDGSPPSADRLGPRSREALFDQALGLGVEVALRPGPEVVEVATHLGRELVGGPRL